MIIVYDMPDNILSTLELKDRKAILNPLDEEKDQNSAHLDTAKSEDSPKDGDSQRSASCNTCGLIFTSHLDQRDHVRSDLHRYNTKRRLNELTPVFEDEFEELIASLFTTHEVLPSGYLILFCSNCVEQISRMNKASQILPTVRVT